MDIVELLAHPGNEKLRFSDVVRELDLTQATAHAILKTLADRGWVTRDPADKTFTLGPALAVVAERVAALRPHVRAAVTAVTALAVELGCAASVVERIDDELVFTAFVSDGRVGNHPVPGDRIPYVPPFGTAFAAWDSPDEQRSWIARAASAELAGPLAELLTRTRARRFDIDWTTPALTDAARILGALPSAGLPTQVRAIMDQLLAEFTSIGLLSGAASDGEAKSVATIAAPVFDDRGRVCLIVAVHPLRPLNQTEVSTIGERLVAVSATL